MKNITIVVLAMLALLCSAYAQECIHITAVQDSTERTPFSTCEGRNCSHTGTAYWVHHNRAYKATIDNRMFTLEESSVWHRPHSDLEVGHDYEIVVLGVKPSQTMEIKEDPDKNGKVHTRKLTVIAEEEVQVH